MRELHACRVRAGEPGGEGRMHAGFGGNVPHFGALHTFNLLLGF